MLGGSDLCLACSHSFCKKPHGPMDAKQVVFLCVVNLGIFENEPSFDRCFLVVWKPHCDSVAVPHTTPSEPASPQLLRSVSSRMLWHLELHLPLRCSQGCIWLGSCPVPCHHHCAAAPARHTTCHGLCAMRAGVLVLPVKA